MGCACGKTGSSGKSVKQGMLKQPATRRPAPEQMQALKFASAAPVRDAAIGYAGVHQNKILSGSEIHSPVLQLSQAYSTNCACGANEAEERKTGCACNQNQVKPANKRIAWRQIGEEVFTTGARLLAMFQGFAFIGYFLNGLIPFAWIKAIFGKRNIYSVPLAATLGLPLYINTEASLPLVRGLNQGGMSLGAALAFLITGAGTSIGASTIARWRVMATVVGTLWVGAILMGGLYNVILAAGWF
jgi:uncharacterized membrane protein YraQ (UPF0718 family)